MSETHTPAAPVPGPTPDTVSQASRAGFHAREASRYLASIDLNDSIEDKVDLATIAAAHALTSTAWSKLRQQARADHGRTAYTGRAAHHG